MAESQDNSGLPCLLTSLVHYKDPVPAVFLGEDWLRHPTCYYEPFQAVLLRHLCQTADQREHSKSLNVPEDVASSKVEQAKPKKSVTSQRLRKSKIICPYRVGGQDYSLLRSKSGAYTAELSTSHGLSCSASLQEELSTCNPGSEAQEQWGRQSSKQTWTCLSGKWCCYPQALLSPKADQLKVQTQDIASWLGFNVTHRLKHNLLVVKEKESLWETWWLGPGEQGSATT